MMCHQLLQLPPLLSWQRDWHLQAFAFQLGMQPDLTPSGRHHAALSLACAIPCGFPKMDVPSSCQSISAEVLGSNGKRLHCESCELV